MPSSFPLLWKMSFEYLHESGHLKWDLARVRRRLYIRCNIITVAKFLCRGRRAVFVSGLCTIPYSKILKDQVLLDWFCTRPVFPVLRSYRGNVCYSSILHAYSISTTRVVHMCTAYYTRVQHTTRVYTHGVMPRVLC